MIWWFLGGLGSVYTGLLLAGRHGALVLGVLYYGGSAWFLRDRKRGKS